MSPMHFQSLALYYKGNESESLKRSREAIMLKNDSKQSDKEDYVDNKVEKARARKHKVRWSYVALLALCLAVVGIISIYMIEIHQ
jgi:hypothetical protein